MLNILLMMLLRLTESEIYETEMESFCFCLNDFALFSEKMFLFVSKSFCGYARPPGWTNKSHDEDGDIDVSSQPGEPSVNVYR